MVSKIGMAVFGFGRMGNIYAKTIMLSPRAELRWIVAHRSHQQFIDTFNLRAKFTTPDKLEPLFNDPSLNAILICSPTSSHEPFIRKAIDSGKSVFCEKPLTSDRISTENCYDLALEKNIHLYCAFNRRFDPSFQMLWNNIRNENLGSLRLLKTSSRDNTLAPMSYLKHSGGIFMDSTIHDLDLCHWLAGAKPRSVFVQGKAFIREVKEINDVDHVVVVVNYENGVISVTDNCRTAGYGYDQRVEALCEKGMYTVGNQMQTSLTEHGQIKTNAPRDLDNFSTRYSEAYERQLNHFLDVVEGIDELCVKKEDTLWAMRLAEACSESHQSGRLVEFAD